MNALCSTQMHYSKNEVHYPECLYGASGIMLVRWDFAFWTYSVEDGGNFVKLAGGLAVIGSHCQVLLNEL